MVNIALVGCTGSIGRQVTEVVRAHPDRFRITALVCKENTAALHALAAEFSPRVSCLAADVKDDLFDGCDVAFIAAGGFGGLAYTLAAIRAGKKIALANKESLVCGGEIVMREAEARGVEIVPVDSEHSALFQALSFRRDAPFRKLILTASGGPFLHATQEELRRVTAADALKHPNWKMGAKITVDSATMLNKGYEVIEAKWLYRTTFDKIEAVVHPESIVHSAVCFEDGAAIAQLGYPDMRVPIQLALTYPERLSCAPQLDFSKLGKLTFLPMPDFPCFRLALQAGREGGTAPTVLNAAGEVAVNAFLRGGIGFLQIAETIEETLSAVASRPADSFGTLQEVDGAARAAARRYLYGT